MNNQDGQSIKDITATLRVANLNLCLMEPPPKQDTQVLKP